MQEMVNIFIFGKKYSVPGDLTIMTAMEYARLPAEARLRLPSWILRRLRHHLQNQGKEPS